MPEQEEVVVLYGPNGEWRYVKISEVAYWIALGWTPYPFGPAPEITYAEQVIEQWESDPEWQPYEPEQGTGGRVVAGRPRAPAPEEEPFLPPPIDELQDAIDRAEVSEYIEDHTIVYFEGEAMPYSEFRERARLAMIDEDHPTGRDVFPPGGTITWTEFNQIFMEVFGHTADQGGDETDPYEDLLKQLIGALSGGGRAPRPVYKAPDRALVRQAVESTLVALVGRKSEARVEHLIQVYMDADKRNFHNRSQQIDPMSEVKKVIEQYSDYKSIHALRPDTADPMTWIATSEGALLRAGVSPQLASDLARVQATLASTPDEAARAGEVYTFQQTRRVLPGFFKDLQGSIGAALELL